MPITNNEEWLVADQRGYFAMGTAAGERTRKYHSFLSAIAGRQEQNLLADLDVTCLGQGLWPHIYRSSSGPVRYPEQCARLENFSGRPWPTWTFSIHEGILSLRLLALDNGGLSLVFLWNGSGAAPLELRPLWAMRALHGLGGRSVEATLDSGDTGNRVASFSASGSPEVFMSCDSPFEWHSEKEWYRGFYYEQERERGYDFAEDLFSAGRLTLLLEPGISRSISVRAGAAATQPARARRNLCALEDFILFDPPGIVAGYPWFGEWGRDTFISLPGLFAGIVDHDPYSTETMAAWAIQLLRRWGTFIESDGMLPNLIGTDGPQWESADATLWWTHSLASLWAMSLARPKLGLGSVLAQEFGRHLDLAIDSIEHGRHRHLKLRDDGLLEVVTGHATWMDARVNGQPVTPRTGPLPEINALWVQACCLRRLWRGQPVGNVALIAKAALDRATEPGCSSNTKERPNTVFLHSLPLAPSFLLHDIESMRRDSGQLERLVTPVGLRTLAPGAEGYRGRYEGNQANRDSAYHQGPAWGWLLGHYHMAAERFQRAGLRIINSLPQRDTKLSTIQEHFAEIFDGDEPWSVRGAPAQAWSVACLAEARLHKEWKVDDALSAVIAIKQQKGPNYERKRQREL